MSFSTDQVLADMGQWLERAVIGLNLCPFAKSVYVKGQVHFVVSHEVSEEAVCAVLAQQLQELANLPPDVRDTTLLVLPNAWPDFLDFNEFQRSAEALLAELDLEGVLQIASFHPLFQFAGTVQDDVTNFTNRAPYPTLHLLRESSIDRAVEAFPEAETIYERNMEVLRRLGRVGWTDLAVGPGEGRI